jgi:predicted RNA-binding protein with PIN domain
MISMRHFIIDGNNLIGKIKTLHRIQKKAKQDSREKLALILSRYFKRKKVSVSLHFDGFLKEEIKIEGIRIYYSGKYTADERIKFEIEKIKNPKNITLITSDSNLAEYGRVCSCKVIKSEEFAAQLLSSNVSDEEEQIISQLNNNEEFKRIFGIKS